MDKNDLWEERYRPAKIADVILPMSIKGMFTKYVNAKNVPNLLLCSASPGSGKTTTARALFTDAGYEYIEINASDDSGIDVLRTRIKKFATTKSLSGKPKGVILDEADYLSPAFQAALRSSIETYSGNCRFILTCNYPARISVPLKSRLKIIDFGFMDIKHKAKHIASIVKRANAILKKHEIESEDGVIEELVEAHYPDVRNVIKTLQQYSESHGIINRDVLNFVAVDSELYSFILKKNITKAREYIISKGFQFEDLYSDFFKNFVDLAPEEARGAIIITLAEWQYKNGFVSDKELNFTACMLEIVGIIAEVE